MSLHFQFQYRLTSVSAELYCWYVGKYKQLGNGSLHTPYGFPGLLTQIPDRRIFLCNIFIVPSYEDIGSVTKVSTNDSTTQDDITQQLLGEEYNTEEHLV